VTNLPSRRVMERLSMTRDEQADFDHPAVSAGHPLQRHVLYRIGAEQWRALPAT
jgi:RimJ/RimL family protein N-acetyltransferase